MLRASAFRSSSRGRRDPVSGSRVPTTDWELAVEDEASSSSMGTSLMKDS
ncbi:hypothetical protein PC116_g17657 [Phytophthora cactorum]|nr:hypothetical protein C6341_g17505 [Phytophthora cactorum]KAG4234173.1 hypothetical protein PC116_g17657 [Phytophthora cactorum]